MSTNNFPTVVETKWIQKGEIPQNKQLNWNENAQISLHLFFFGNEN